MPQDYEIRKYGRAKKNTQPAATDLIGQKAPDWMLKDMYEKPVALSEFKSKVLLVNLTGTVVVLAMHPFLFERIEREVQCR